MRDSLREPHVLQRAAGAEKQERGDYAARVAHLPIGLGGRRPINRANVTRDVLLPEWRRVSVRVPWTCSLSQLHARLLLDYDDIFGGCSVALGEELALEVEGRVAVTWR